MNIDAALVAALPMLGRYARKLERDYRGAVEADDLVQATALKMLEHRESFMPGRNARTSFNGWGARILHNACFNAGKRAGARQHVEISDAGEDAALTVPPSQERGLDIRDRLRIFASLPEWQRALLLERVVEGRSIAEIAQREGVSTTTILTRVHRARAKLRAAMGGAA